MKLREVAERFLPHRDVDKKITWLENRIKKLEPLAKNDKSLMQIVHNYRGQLDVLMDIKRRNADRRLQARPMDENTADPDWAYTQGYDAFREGVHLDDNPFPPKHRFYQMWRDGWTEAARERAIPAE